MNDEMPPWAKFIREKKPVFDGASRVLESLWHARGGGRLATGLAGVAALGAVVDLVYPAPGPWRAIQEYGFEHRTFALSVFIANTLLTFTDPEVVSSDEESKAYLWRDESGAPAFGFYVRGDDRADLFIGPRGDDLLRKILQAVWDQGSELVVHRTPTKDLTLTPLATLGPYIGGRTPDYYVKRLARYGPGPRTILLRGPTGVGKSVLGRHISAGLGRGASRTLKISSEALKSCEGDEILSLVQWLRPTVLLLDDLELGDPSQTSTFLALLETLRDPDTLVIVTMMISHHWEDVTPDRGSWHLPGMRPGRIEETFTLYLPEEEDRETRHHQVP